MRLFLSRTLLGVALLATLPAAAVPRSRLVYVRGEGAESCPEAIELRLSVLHRLGYDPFAPSARPSILVQIRRESEQLHATVELLDDQGISQGSRYLDAPANSCDELIAAAALSISLAIDPERALAHVDTASTTEQRTEPETPAPDPSDGAAAPQTPPATTRPVAVSQPRHTQRELVLSLHGASRALAEPNLGLDVGFGLRRWTWSFSLEARADLPVSISVGPHANLTTWLMMATLVPCLRGSVLRFCGLAGYGVLGASSSGVQHPNADRASFGAVGLRLGSERPISRRLRLGVHVDTLAALANNQARLGDSVVWKSNRLSGLFGLDLAWDIE